MKLLKWLCIVLMGLVMALVLAVLLPTPTTAANTRPTHYYLVDRVLNNADFATLASWGIDTAVVDIGINASTASWQSVLTAASNAGVNIVIWPDQGGDVAGCGWETPFNSPQNGNYIWRVTSMLDFWAGNPHVDGIVIAHEPAGSSSSNCRDSVADMSAIKTQIKSYVLTKFGRTDFKIWNYVDNVVANLPNLPDYSGPADYEKIMDVAVTWQHCAGNAEGPCDTGNDSALSRIQEDAAALAGHNVELVYLMQTFTYSGGYSARFTLPQLENYSCEFLNTSLLDGFGFYTWDAGWWPDLHGWPDVQPAVPYIHQNCTNNAAVTPSQTPTGTITVSPSPTNTPTPTSTPTVNPSSFTFASMSDSHDQVPEFTGTINQVRTLNPNFIIFNGDYENNGVATSEMNDMTTVLNNASLFNNAFIVRGNHDDELSGSAAPWQTYFTNRFGSATHPLPAGASNYVGLNASSTYLSYSFDYGNSRFIGLDVPGDADLLSSAQYTFLDNRLTDAESLGLTHAFIYFHGPEYCVEDTHCGCTSRTDASCTPSQFITIVNRHPIISATFHGHEHVLGHVHMDNTRISTLTHPYEEFFTSSAGMPYAFTTFTARIDQNYSSSSLEFLRFYYCQRPQLYDLFLSRRHHHAGCVPDLLKRTSPAGNQYHHEHHV